MKIKKTKMPLRLRLVFLTRNWIWLLWALMLPLVWILLPLDRLSSPITGVVTAETETVGAIETVRIRALPVAVGQRVTPGDVLVEVEGFAEQKERLEALDYTVRMLDIRQNTQQQEQTLFALGIRTRQTLEDTRVALAEKEMEQMRDTAMLEGLREEAERLAPLVGRGLVPDTELARIRPQINTLVETVAGYSALIGALLERIALAEADLAQIIEWRVANLSPLTDEQERAITAINTTVCELEKGAVAHLRAKSEGVVSRVQFAVGDIVPAGTPILRVTSQTRLTVVGMLRPHQAALVREGMTLAVVPPFRESYTRHFAQVSHIETEVLDLTDPFTPPSRNRFPVRGRRIILTLDDDSEHDLIPGESVTILLPPPTIQQRLNNLADQFRWRVNEKQTGWK